MMEDLKPAKYELVEFDVDYLSFGDRILTEAEVVKWYPGTNFCEVWLKTINYPDGLSILISKDSVARRASF